MSRARRLWTSGVSALLLASGCATPTNPPLYPLPAFTAQGAMPPRPTTCAVITRFPDGVNLKYVDGASKASELLVSRLNAGANGHVAFRWYRDSRVDIAELDEDYVMILTCEIGSRVTTRNGVLMAIAWPATFSVIFSPLGIIILSIPGLVHEDIPFDWVVTIGRPSEYPDVIEKHPLPTVHARVSATGWGTPERVIDEAIANSATHVVGGAVEVANDFRWPPPPRPSDPVVGPWNGRTVAVLTFDASGVPLAETAALTDRFAVELDGKRIVVLLNRKKMKEILGEQSNPCTDTACAIEAGKLLSVEYIVFGTIAKVGSLYTGTVQAVCVETSKVVGSASIDFGGKIEDALPGMSALVDKLVESVSGVRSEQVRNRGPDVKR